MGMSATSDRPATRRFSADDVWRMVQAGVLGPDEPYELIDGQLVYVSPQNPPHATAIGRLNMALAVAYAPHGYVVRVQCPIEGIADSIPEPDIAVVPAAAAEQDQHPRADQTVLIVEVADTSLRGDVLKRPIYAAAGGPVYWIVDLNRDVVTVHGAPAPDGTWRQVRETAPGEELALPGIEARLPVAAILRPGP